MLLPVAPPPYPVLPLVALDTGVLGLLTHPDPRRSPEARRCLGWMQTLVARDAVILLPEIVDYEERREYLRRGGTRSLTKLDALVATYDYLPLSTGAMHGAASLWAQLRQNGKVTADPREIDGDAILAAQVIEEVQARRASLRDVVVATTNIAHLSWMLQADAWDNIL